MGNVFFSIDEPPCRRSAHPSPGSLWLLGPGEGEWAGARKQPGKESQIWLGIKDTRNECHPHLNSGGGQGRRRKAYFMGEISPLELRWGPVWLQSLRETSETFQHQGVLSSPSSILRDGRVCCTTELKPHSYYKTPDPDTAQTPPGLQQHSPHWEVPLLGPPGDSSTWS